jgi:hypothetical protein
MQIVTLVIYILVMALVAAFLLWAGERILLALRTRKQRRRRKAVNSVAGDETQYSMFPQTPSGDDAEFDPLAEAEIYLIYGNRQMALDTLIKATQEHPEREDIRNRLAELQNSDRA